MTLFSGQKGEEISAGECGAMLEDSQDHTWIRWEKRMNKGAGLARRRVRRRLPLQENLATKGTACFQAGMMGGTLQWRRKNHQVFPSDTNMFFKIMKFTFPKVSFSNPTPILQLSHGSCPATEQCVSPGDFLSVNPDLTDYRSRSHFDLFPHT